MNTLTLTQLADILEDFAFGDIDPYEIPLDAIVAWVNGSPLF